MADDIKGSWDGVMGKEEERAELGGGCGGGRVKGIVVRNQDRIMCKSIRRQQELSSCHKKYFCYHWRGRWWRREGDERVKRSEFRMEITVR